MNAAESNRRKNNKRRAVSGRDRHIPLIQSRQLVLLLIRPGCVFLYVVLIAQAAAGITTARDLFGNVAPFHICAAKGNKEGVFSGRPFLLPFLIRRGQGVRVDWGSPFAGRS